MPDRDPQQPPEGPPAEPNAEENPSPQPAKPRKPKRPPPPVSPYPVGHPLRKEVKISRVARLRALSRGEIVPGAPGGGTLYLRCLAGIHYTTSRREDMSIPLLHEIDLFKEVSLGTLSDWCKADRWVEKRREFFAALGKDIEERIRRHVGAVKVEQLQVMDDLFARMGKKSKKLEPKSLEGLAVAMTRVLESANELRDQIVTSSTTVLSVESQPVDDALPLTDDQVRELALQSTISQKALPPGEPGTPSTPETPEKGGQDGA